MKNYIKNMELAIFLLLLVLIPSLKLLNFNIGLVAIPITLYITGISAMIIVSIIEPICNEEHRFTTYNIATTYIKNLEEIYRGFKVIERKEVVKSCDGRIIKKQRRKFGIATTRSADRAFRRAGLKSMDIDDAKADLALIGAKDLLAIASRSD